MVISTRTRPKDGSTDAGICLCTYLTYLDLDMSSTCAKSGDASHRQDPLPLNSAVIVRVWPRPYSVWEDNPEDPEAIDGTSASVRKATQNHLVNRQNYWELYVGPGPSCREEESGHVLGAGEARDCCHFLHQTINKTSGGGWGDNIVIGTSAHTWCNITVRSLTLHLYPQTRHATLL